MHKAIWLSGIVALSLTCTTLAKRAVAVEHSEDAVAATLARLVDHCPARDLPRLWGLYMELFAHPDASQITYPELRPIMQRCEGVGLVAWVLGKGRATLDVLDGFQPAWEEPDIWRTWRHMQRHYLPESGRRHFLPAASLPLSGDAGPTPSPFHAEPYVKLSFGSHDGKGLVDTGATFSVFPDMQDRFPHLDPLSGSVRHHLTLADGSSEPFSTFAVPGARIGDEWYRPFVVVSGAGLDYLPPVVGMSFLLRFAAVCFSWHEAVLHLGELGPCSKGVPSTDWFFSHGLGITTTVADVPGAQTMIDTGAHHSMCPKSFFHLAVRRYTVHRGTVEVTCEYDDVHIALLGMDTLRRFSAFGWTRDPLQVVFVP